MSGRRYKLTDADREVMEKAASLETGGMPVFTSYYFAPIHGNPRWDLVWRNPDAIDKGFLSEEWDNRVPPDEWDLDAERGDYVPWVPLSWQAMLAHDERLDATVIAGFGAGKAQPLDAKVLTPSGWVEMGNLVVGDAVIGSDGKPHRVTGIYPQGKQPVFEVRFSDGAVTQCTPDHLWTVRGAGKRPYRTLTLKQIMARREQSTSLYPAAWRVYLPPLAPVEYSSCVSLPIAPYVLGVLLGDGGLTQDSVYLATADDEMPRSVPALASALRGLGLMGCGSESKFIPQQYLFAPPADRLALLQGLLDTDGCVSRAGAAAFSTASHQLALDVQTLVRSLGGTATLGTSDSRYRYRGECRQGKTRYRLYIKMPRGLVPFRLGRKAEAFSASCQHDAVRGLRDWRYVGEKECQCIEVDAPDGLYVTDDFILTHNTVGMAAVLCYWCCMIPNFKAMDVAPVGWQAKQMYDAIRQELVDYDNRHERPTRISQMVLKMVERPYPKIVWYNGSTVEFMSADEQGQKILSWSGDVAVVDEAGKLGEVARTDLDELLINLGSRMRGQVGGRKRLGKMIVMSTADYDPELWERFDMAERLPEHYLSILVTTWDNPYLTKKQIEAMGRRIKDPQRRRQLMRSERPLPRGGEFPPELLKPCQCPALDDLMRTSLEAEVPGFEVVERQGAGVVRWVTPPSEFDRYILIGDPGQNTPPQRNSAVVMAFRVTGFPQIPAELAAFHWIDGGGSYWPFINQMEEWARAYKPIYSAFDATGVQKGFDELVFTQRGLLMEGINMQRQKMQMVVALKLILGKRLLLMPERIQGIWLQLANWRMPDTKLRQDIASTLFMTAYVLNRLFVIDEEEVEEEETEPYRPGRSPRRHNPRLLRQKPGRSRR